ncbi:MAG TPA: DnaJ domain-containing protein, partial [Ktedonobacterales bacterium]|nr:DnaJ domain-containing protein [Ktedonobacterales bacterium]
MRQDFYAVLGVSQGASADEIRQAYRQRARQLHPDASPNDPAATEQFKLVTEAYQVLGTPQLRAAYDRALLMVTPPGMDTRASQAHIPTPTTANPAAAFRGSPRVTFNADGRPTNAARPHPQWPPVLSLTVTPSQESLVPLREMCRFYILAELGAARAHAVLDPLPLDLALAIDRSSSMRGAKIEGVKAAVRNTLDQLSTDDRLTLVFFDDKAEVVADGETMQGRAGLEHALESLHVKGGTQISNALATTLERLAARQNRARVASLVLLTDGQTYGDDDKCFEHAGQARDMGISIAALGLGLDWNRELLDRLAAISGGGSQFVEKAEDVQQAFEDVVRRLRATLAAGMRMTFEPAPGVRIVRATRVAPEIVEGFTAWGDGAAGIEAANGPVTIDLGALVGRPDIESAVVVWEIDLDPSLLLNQNNNYLLGRISATSLAPRVQGAHQEHLETLAQVTL